MARQTPQVAAVHTNPPPISQELRGWIERILVPILVKEYLRIKHSREDGDDG